MVEKVSVEEAVKRLVEVDINNTNKINKLEAQIDEMFKAFTDHQCSTKTELQTVSESIESIQSATTSYYEEATSKNEENKQQLQRIHTDMNVKMNGIFSKLNEITKSNIIPSSIKHNEDDRGREQEIQQNRVEILPTTTNQTATSSLGHTFEMSSNGSEPEARYKTIVQQAFPLNGMKHSIIVPPASAAPAFHGKHTDTPTQFLIRVQEYAESVHAWDYPTLLTGISQFLRDSALEWYCQLRLSHRRPTTWTEFKDLFLAQFNSPVRKARQEQEWHECKQKENETINEFLVRLRALWREQKPKETENQLVKHLFCRMRNDLLNMIGISRNASLNEVVAEVQQIEDILYRRAKGERLTKQIKQASFSNAEISPNKRYNEDYPRRTTSWSNKEDLSNNYTRKMKGPQINEVTPGYYSYDRNQSTVEPNNIQQIESYGCYTCGDYGHWARDCPIQYGTYRQERNKTYPKNFGGALDERTSHAPL